MNDLALLCLALIAAPIATETEAIGDISGPETEIYQTIFFAVLEGAYRDGLSDAALGVILSAREGSEYEYFVYACPLCTPTVAALELYRSRPSRLYSLKGSRNTFGSGIPADVESGLNHADEDERLAGITRLIRRWIDGYLESKNLGSAEREAWERRIEAAKKEGDRLLQQYRSQGSAALTAPALQQSGECVICAGAFEGAIALGGRLNSSQP